MPRIKTTPTVRVALWALRIYLLILLSLIGLKFARAFSASHKANASTAAVHATQTNSPPAGTKQ
jgi:hypothetical protein